VQTFDAEIGIAAVPAIALQSLVGCAARKQVTLALISLFF
jgi:hypothetical protein